MIVYWLLLAWTTFVSLTWKKWFIFKVKTVNGRTRTKPLLLSYLFAMLPLIVIIGMRSEIADTASYIASFKTLPTSFSEIIKLSGRDYLFYRLSALIKMIYPHPNFWLTVVAFIQVLLICVSIRRYSEMPGISFFLFVASTEFSYMLNGMRQFVAVTILFAAYRLLVEKKYIPYILLIILAAQFHGTAYVMLVGLLVSFIKPWSKIMYAFVAVFTAAMVFLEPILSGLKIFFEDSEYSSQMAELMEAEGTNIIRAFVALVPLAIGFLFRKNKAVFERRENVLAFNMSMLNAAFFIASSIVGGNLMARFAEYFTIFQLLTYPALFKNCFKKGQERNVVVLIFGLVYCFWFWYQLDVNWNFHYVSDVLGLRV